MIRLLALMSLTVCLTCSPAIRQIDQSTATADYIADGGYWNDGATITILARAEPRGDVTAICGIWQVDYGSALTIGFHDRVMATGIVRIDGANVLHNLLFMNRIAEDSAAIGQSANCAVTDIAWQPGTAERVSIRIPRQTFGGGLGSDEPRLTFRQGQISRPFG